jgi:hypothetical protein
MCFVFQARQQVLSRHILDNIPIGYHLPREPRPPAKKAACGGDRKRRCCKFCLKNGEPPMVVTGHNLRDRQGLVECPILQRYRCPLCQATGKKAHTLKYCPFNEPGTPHELVLQARYSIERSNALERQLLRSSSTVILGTRDLLTGPGDHRTAAADSRQF